MASAADCLCQGTVMTQGQQSSVWLGKPPMKGSIHCKPCQAFAHCCLSPTVCSIPHTTEQDRIAGLHSTFSASHQKDNPTGRRHGFCDQLVKLGDGGQKYRQDHCSINISQT